MPRDELQETVEVARQVVKGLQRQLRAAAQVLARLEELLDQNQPCTAEEAQQHGNQNTIRRDPARA